MGLLKTITRPGAKRPLGWVVASTNNGNVLVVKRTPRAIAVTTRRSEFVSINESAAQGKAGWTLDDYLIQAIKNYHCNKVVVYVPKPGILYMTDAGNYRKSGVVYTAAVTKEGPRLRCVGIEHFERTHYRVKI